MKNIKKEIKRLPCTAVDKPAFSSLNREPKIYGCCAMSTKLQTADNWIDFSVLELDETKVTEIR